MTEHERDVLEDLAHRLRQWSLAYPEEIFRPLSAEDRAELHRERPGLHDRLAADMGRHIGRSLAAMADDLERLLR